MAHLGADVAAFVDGQLSEPATRAAMDHLQTCDACAKAVRQQRLLKSRMSTVAAPEPPPSLVASLSGLAADPPADDGWWTRMRRSVPVRAGLVLVSASFAVVATAYAMGGGERQGDEVAPPFERYAAEFHGRAAVQAAHVIETSTMQRLDGDGWPCHERLAGDLRRTSAAFVDQREVLALSYTDGVSKLNLFEQAGSLDRASLEGFETAVMGGSPVWLREGEPTVVTWDDDGVVYTVVTDVDTDRVARAVSQLPRGSHDPGPAERVRDGLDRMTAWMDAA